MDDVFFINSRHGQVDSNVISFHFATLSIHQAGGQGDDDDDDTIFGISSSEQ